MASALALPFAETIFPSFSQALPHHVGLNANVITPEKACRGQRPPIIPLTPLLLTSPQFIFIASSIADAGGKDRGARVVGVYEGRLQGCGS